MSKCLTVLLLSVALEGAPVEPPKFAARLRKAEDRFEATATPKGVVWRITSKSGIGGAVVDLTAGTAPTRWAVQLVPLKTLEGLQLEDDVRRLEARLGAGGKKATFLFDAAGKAIKEARFAAVILTVEARPGPLVEVTISYPAGVPPGRRWVLSWVDAYRN